MTDANGGVPIQIIGVDTPISAISVNPTVVTPTVVNVGSSGIAGPVGLTGPVGPVGPQGPKGDIGLTGPLGPTGLTGAQGPKGDIGLTGAQGPIGPTGLTGAQGPKGDTGLTGANGADGVQGSIGPTGLTGAQGPKGDTGLTGAQGPIGPAGLTGANGADGAQGPIGPAGANGTNATLVGNRIDDVLINGIAEQTPLSYSSATNTNFCVRVYFRVVNATTNVTIIVGFTSNGGVQTNTMLNAQVCTAGEYSLVPLFLNIAAGTTINVRVTASIANNVYISASVLEG